MQRNTTNDRTPIPLLGAITITAGLLALCWGLSEVQPGSTVHGPIIGAFVGGAILLALFVGHEVTAHNPLVERSVFATTHAYVNLVVGIQAAVVSTAVLIGSLYLQQMLCFDPRAAGVATLALPAGVAFGAYGANRALRRWAAGPALLLGGMASIAGSLLWVGVDPHGSYATTMLPAWAVLGTGMGASQLPMVSWATARLSPGGQGAGVGVYDMAQQVGAPSG